MWFQINKIEVRDDVRRDVHPEANSIGIFSDKGKEYKQISILCVYILPTRTKLTPEHTLWKLSL